MVKLFEVHMICFKIQIFVEKKFTFSVNYFIIVSIAKIYSLKFISEIHNWT